MAYDQKQAVYQALSVTALDTGPPLVTMTWDQFLRHMKQTWEPGEHMANIGPTGEGKTTLNVGLLGHCRRYVLALDPKGEDETLEASGWVRVRKIPGGRTWGKRDKLKLTEDGRKWDKIWQGIDDGKPARVIVGGGASTAEADRKLIELMEDAISFARHSRGWTLYVDEFELLSSQRMYGLGRHIERMLISARRAKTSVVTSFQAAAWVSKHATRQARRTVMYSTGDRQMIKNVAEAMGRDWNQLAAAIDELPKWYAVVIPRGKNGGPMILVSAPAVL